MLGIYQAAEMDVRKGDYAQPFPAGRQQWSLYLDSGYSDGAGFVEGPAVQEKAEQKDIFPGSCRREGGVDFIAAYEVEDEHGQSNEVGSEKADRRHDKKGEPIIIIIEKKEPIALSRHSSAVKTQHQHKGEYGEKSELPIAAA